METEKECKELKLVDLTKSEVENINGDKEKLCIVEEGKEPQIGFVVKQFANTIYSQSKDLGEVEIARLLYKTGKAEMTKTQAEAIKGYVKDYPYILRTAIESAFDVF